MIVRATARMLKLLGGPRLPAAEGTPGDDDWFMDLMWFSGRKCVLVTHAASTFSVFVPDVRKPDLVPLGRFLKRNVTTALDAEGLPHGVLGDLQGQAVLARTNSRRVLGHMNDIKLAIELDVIEAGGLEGLDLIDLHAFLQRRIHGKDGTVPLDVIHTRLGDPPSGARRRPPPPHTRH